jgi:hypothetical protein
MMNRIIVSTLLRPYIVVRATRFVSSALLKHKLDTHRACASALQAHKGRNTLWDVAAVNGSTRLQ